jgi:hypothetical protein
VPASVPRDLSGDADLSPGAIVAAATVRRARQSSPVASSEGNDNLVKATQA